MTRPFFAIALAVAALAAIRNDPPVLAQTVNSLSTSATADGSDTSVFPESTTQVWVRFGFSGAGTTKYEVTLYSPSGVAMFTRDAELSGSGTAVWAISGDAVARGLAARVAESASTAQDYAQRAGSQQVGITEFLATTTFAVNQMETSLRLIGQVPLDQTSRAHRNGAVVAAGDVRRLLTLASTLPAGDIAGRQAYARQMSTPAARAVSEAAALEVALGAATDLPLPPTRSATSDSDAYVVVVRINGFAAQSKSLWLFDGTIFLPAAAQNATW